MSMKRRVAVISAFAIVSVLVGSLFYYNMVKAQDVRQYDPWCDLNDDGKINIRDIALIAIKFRTDGTPINKTAILLDLQSKMENDIFQSGLLLHLPYGATQRPPMSGSVFIDTILYSLDLNQSELGNQQSIFVRKGSTITVTGEFQIYDNPCPSCIRQVFFIYSWTPSWPPPSEDYYHPLYNGIPGPWPGVTQTFDFNLTVPDELGVYYLYFAGGGEYNMEDAVNKYTESLWVPYAIIIVGW